MTARPSATRATGSAWAVNGSRLPARSRPGASGCPSRCRR
jgi:hypothetical protein